VTVFRRSILLLLLICLGCAAQSAPPDVSTRVERKIRAYYNLPAQVKIVVGPLKPSEFPNYDSFVLTLDNNGREKKDLDFLLSKDQKTLIRWTKLDLSKDPYAETMAKIDVSGRPVRGNKDAKVVAVNYDDFECPFCAHMHQTLFPELLKEYGDRVAFIYKDFPLVQIHPWAIHAAVDANCLAAQSGEAYWDFADYIHANQKDVNSEKDRLKQFSILDNLAFLQGQKHNLDSAKLSLCVKAQNDTQIKASIKEGESLGVDATPTMFVNGEKIDGALPINEIRAVLDRALQAAGVPVPAHPASAASSGQPSPAGK
jgi:protein-disulfide isomerase